MINGDLKSLYPLWIDLASNQRYQKYVTKKDLQTFEKRTLNEGVAFLTITLPKLGKALDKFHSCFVWTCPEGFSSVDGFPTFLGAAIRESFEGDSLAVDCVRQLSYFFYKLEVPFDSDIVRDCLDSFIAVDSSLSDRSNSPLSQQETTVIKSIARGLISRVLCNSNPREIRPRHGSGGTACRTKQWDKYHKLRYYPKLDFTYSYSEHFFYSATHLIDEMKRLEDSEERDPMARVCLVPKDSRGPRIISCEPAELMFIQQGLMTKMYDLIETHDLTSGRVNFTDQTINQTLARDSSMTGEYATLDLKDASDRVSLQLVRELFPNNWVECFESCRSESTELPDGRIVKLNKFSPMGSACCFPVEALVFWAIASAVVRKAEKLYVYGDDIICEATEANVIMNALESVGLLVNRDKCFVSGPFRESCGGEYHNGMDVTPIRLRKPLDLSPSHWLAGVDLANNYIAKFGSSDMRFIRKLEAILGPFPRTELAIPGTLRLEASASNDVLFRRRFDKNYQRFEYLIPRLSIKTFVKNNPDWNELLRKELSRGESLQPFEDQIRGMAKAMTKDLNPGEYADPYSVVTKYGWTWLG